MKPTLTRTQALAACLLTALLAVAIAACAASSANDQLDKVDEDANGYHAFIPKNHVERNNYEKAQKLYDSPNTIIWCTSTWGNPSAPMFTVPVAGKLTSSSVSFFPSTRTKQFSEDGEYTPERRSVDGMYHGTPPPYRYGFTPGGQYIDLFNMPTFCTQAMTKFQRQKTAVSVSIDQGVADATTQAEKALKAGDHAEAQRILQGATGGK